MGAQVDDDVVQVTDLQYLAEMGGDNDTDLARLLDINHISFIMTTTMRILDGRQMATYNVQSQLVNVSHDDSRMNYIHVDGDESFGT